MGITKEALKLFLRSLPPKCKFSIISFGSKPEFLKIGDKNIIEYNNGNVKEALTLINGFATNFGGTDILTPLTQAQELTTDGITEKRIFLLTDGAVKNTGEIIQSAERSSDVCRIHTFGIGDEIDGEFVKKLAQVGRGSYSIFSDNRTKKLNSLVVKAIERAFEPSLKNCEIIWNS